MTELSSKGKEFVYNHHMAVPLRPLGPTKRGIGLKVLSSHGAAIDTTTPAGKLVFGIFASLAEVERDLIAERTKAGLAAARARGRRGGRLFTMTPAKLALAQAGMPNRSQYYEPLQGTRRLAPDNLPISHAKRRIQERGFEHSRRAP